jgi:hypothetical protein
MVGPQGFIRTQARACWLGKHARCASNVSRADPEVKFTLDRPLAFLEPAGRANGLVSGTETYLTTNQWTSSGPLDRSLSSTTSQHSLYSVSSALVQNMTSRLNSLLGRCTQQRYGPKYEHKCQSSGLREAYESTKDPLRIQK